MSKVREAGKRLMTWLLIAVVILGTMTTIYPAAAEVQTKTTEDGMEYNVKEDKTVEITDYFGEETEVVIPTQIEGYPVTSIAMFAFTNCSDLTTIELPLGITSIGDAAFYGCSSLTSIKIPETVTFIDRLAFGGCISLTAIEIPSGVTSIGKLAFASCSALTEINVAAENKNYTSEDGVLFNKEKTELICCPEKKGGKYRIPDEVTSIEDSAFSYCSDLTDISLPDGLTNIEDYVFSNCSGLTMLKIPSGVTSIGTAAFRNCYMLTTVEIPNSVASIGEDAFNFCYSLTDVFYGGSETEWKEILVGERNDALLNATIHYNASAPTPVKYGDVDGDGEVFASDALKVLKAVVHLTSLDEAQEKAADVDGSGKVDATDALLILKYVVNLIDTFQADTV